MKTHKIYRRGQVVQVKFEPQVGYEIKGIHYAIVVTNKDQPYIGTITVIPLTSKSGKHLLSLGDWMSKDIYKYVNTEINYYQSLINDLHKELLDITNNSIEITSNKAKKITDNIDTFNKNIVFFQNIQNKYKNVQKNSYANVYQITTIDKSKILNPCNQLDPIDKIKAPPAILDLLDQKIKDVFTNTK